MTSLQGKNITFKDKTFTILQGTTHPAYSYATFEEEENDFKNKYWNINENDIVFDIGASYGGYALTACALGANVYCFEPEKSVYPDLVNNILVNNWQTKCFPFNFGFWDSLALVNMKTYAPHWPAQTITSDYSMTTIDDFVKTLNIERIDWVKIDVEGVEEKVLNGGINSIKKFKPNLIIECHSFMDADIKNRIKNSLLDIYDFEEVSRPPCDMLVGRAK